MVYCLRAIVVSIHAPTWGATIEKLLHDVALVSFNPRAHVGRDAQAAAVRKQGIVSIHAPTWGATRSSCRQVGGVDVFQSTRPRGARLRIKLGKAAIRRFNPRAHVGRDSSGHEVATHTDVSIHAPTWGATRSGVRSSMA